MLGWLYYNASHPPVQPPRPAAGPAATQLTAAATPQSAVPEPKKPAETPSEPAVQEQTQKFDSPSVQYVFSNLGGGISRAELLKHTVENGGNVTLNESGDVPVGAVSERAGEGANAPYSITGSRDAGIVCERTTPEKIRIVKKFTLPKANEGKDQYLVSLEVTFTNEGAQPYKSDGYYLYAGSAAPIHKNDLPMYTGFDWYHDGKAKDINVMAFSAGHIPLLGIQTSPEKTNITEKADNIIWSGVYSQYFTNIVTASGANADRIWTRRISVEKEDKSVFGIEGALGMPGFTLKPGESLTQQFGIYLGPRQYGLLKQLGNGQDQILQFGMFGIVSKFLLWSMNHLKNVLGSYAAAILVLTLCIKTFMWPLQNRATQSMKKMQAVQPKMNEIREKYKDDPTRMNQETMKLYKDYGINPFGGCLPMFIQIPIFFGFYRMLGTAIELRNSKFLWVKDLSQPDTVFHLAGVPVNILPLCMAVTMLWQMSLSPKSGDAVQQRVMMFVPLIFIFFCYNYASALALYWTVQNLFSIVQLYVTRNQAAPALQKAAVAGGKKRR